jgi:diguanylate cyclase (GGDEF)-like protein
MQPSTPSELLALSGVDARDERELRIWTAIAMWLGGVAAGALVLHSNPEHGRELWGLLGFCAAAATLTFLLFPRVSNRSLYRLTNTFSSLGAVAVWFACFWSGGVNSGLFGLYMLPTLYDAYFFKPRHALIHLVMNCALVVSPLLYTGSLQGTQFPARATVLVLAMCGMFVLVTSRKRNLLLAELNARRRALSDPLTGLHNLRSLREQAADQSLRDGTALFEIDIDDFKGVNTHYGHIGADEVLRRVALALLELTRGRDCAARIGGDEFAILVHDRTGPEIELLRGACANAVRVAGAGSGAEKARLSASVGCAVWPRDGRVFAELLDAADRDMYRAKARITPASTRARALRRPHPVAIAERRTASRRSTPDSSSSQRRGEADALTSREAVARSRLRDSLLGWWRTRPLNAVAGALAWLGGAAIGLVVVSLPDSHPVSTSGAVAVLLFTAATGLFVLILAPALGRRAYLASDALAAPCVALGIYLTGGTTSPLLPLVFFVVAIAVYTPPRGALLCLLGAVLVCASPFAYADDGARVTFIVPFIATITTAAVLVALIQYNKRELAQAEHAARELASHDPLTGLLNRRAFEELVDGALLAVRKEPTATLSVLIIDLDNFKRVNDLHGHAAGDRLLKAIASALTSGARREDYVMRIGGDEFALVARGAGEAGSRAIGERCVAVVDRAVADTGFGHCGVSATVGYAVSPLHGETLDALLEAADAALMRAKDRGKHLVACADEPGVRQLILARA